MSTSKKQDEPEAAERPLGGAEHDVTAGQNAGTAANAYEVRATDPAETGKITSTVKGQNAGGFESRVQQGGSAH